MSRTTVKLALFLGLFCFAAAPLQAQTFSFMNITNNSAVDAGIGEAQLSVDVTAVGGQVLFTFNNSGPLASSITQIYFDDGSLLGQVSIDDSDPGVLFSAGAGPVLPGGETVLPPFVVTVAFSASADAGMGGVQAHGVNPGESVGILFSLQGGQTFADVLADLADGSLRIGIHVQGYDLGGSESFVNNGPVNGVPEPATIFLLGMGLLGMVGAAFTKKRDLGS